MYVGKILYLAVMVVSLSACKSNKPNETIDKQVIEKPKTEIIELLTIDKIDLAFEISDNTELSEDKTIENNDEVIENNNEPIINDDVTIKDNTEIKEEVIENIDEPEETFDIEKFDPGEIEEEIEDLEDETSEYDISTVYKSIDRNNLNFERAKTVVYLNKSKIIRDDTGYYLEIPVDADSHKVLNAYNFVSGVNFNFENALNFEKFRLYYLGDTTEFRDKLENQYHSEMSKAILALNNYDITLDEIDLYVNMPNNTEETDELLRLMFDIYYYDSILSWISNRENIGLNILDSENKKIARLKYEVNVRDLNSVYWMGFDSITLQNSPKNYLSKISIFEDENGYTIDTPIYGDNGEMLSDFYIGAIGEELNLLDTMKFYYGRVTYKIYSVDYERVVDYLISKRESLIDKEFNGYTVDIQEDYILFKQETEESESYDLEVLKDKIEKIDCINILMHKLSGNNTQTRYRVEYFEEIVEIPKIEVESFGSVG